MIGHQNDLRALDSCDDFLLGFRVDLVLGYREDLHAGFRLGYHVSSQPCSELASSRWVSRCWRGWGGGFPGGFRDGFPGDFRDGFPAGRGEGHRIRGRVLPPLVQEPTMVLLVQPMILLAGLASRIQRHAQEGSDMGFP